jgi:serine/threonine protein kinase
MNKPQETAFERCALASGLVSREQVDAARAVLGWPERQPADSPLQDKQLAEALVEIGHLNQWQASQLLVGRTKFSLGPYWITDSIGQGGMGQVFKGEHRVLGRVVAIKVLPQYKSTPEAIASFTREIRAQAKLDHKNLVRAYDAGEDGKVYYLVVEYVPGMDLRKLVRNHGPLTMYEAASVISQVAAALQHAHDEGLIHRDVKPGNVLVTPEGCAKLSDLGLAEPLDADPNDPNFGRIVGTADYISPDHIRNPADPTPAWDIYSLGCTLYYAVTGKVPFPGGKTAKTADKVRAHCDPGLRPLDPRLLNPGLSDQFVDVVADMMAKDPAARIPSVADVVARLKPWIDATHPFLTRMEPPAPNEDAANSMPGSVFGKLRARIGNGPSQRRQGDWGETKVSLPDAPAVATDPKDSSVGIADLTDPLASAVEETYPVLAGGRGDPDATILLHPLVILVLLPMSLVGLVTLAWWLLQWLR